MKETTGQKFDKKVTGQKEAVAKEDGCQGFQQTAGASSYKDLCMGGWQEPLTRGWALQQHNFTL